MEEESITIGKKRGRPSRTTNATTTVQAQLPNLLSASKDTDVRVDKGPNSNQQTGQVVQGRLLGSRFDSDSDDGGIDEAQPPTVAHRYDSDESEEHELGATGNPTSSKKIKAEYVSVAQRYDSDDEKFVGAAPAPTPTKTRAASQASQTVFRDAGGKRINLEAAAKASALESAKELARAKAQAWTSKTGAVQRAAIERRAADAEANRQEGIVAASGGSDVRLARLGETQSMEDARAQAPRAEDPMAPLLALNADRQGGNAGDSKPRKPQYSGPPGPPNRFDIKPGYRWDGVDRGNGFERQIVAQGAATRAKTAASYRMGMAGM